MLVEITSFSALWNGLITHLSLGHHMKIGLGIEIDAGKHHPPIFHILTNKIHYLRYNKLDNKTHFQ